MAFIYPEGPQSVPPNIAKPTPAYARHAAIATLILVLFVALYIATCAWFAIKAYHLLSSGSDSMWVWLAGGSSAFLAVFMVKGLFFVKRGAYSGDVEITARDEPALFQFIHRLADEAGAPRPARVYLSPRVNAAVFYDISILNLLFPSRKNLEIGLGLVNVLTIEEFKAVLAHEFGHFGQRSMLIGRWVYMAQQIAGAIVAKRDALDEFLKGLSRFDVRIAWVGWILSLIVWAIRSLTDSAFRLVILAQRALSREMEMQADLVAVSLTGSDALVHALHRLSAADEAWDRALAFANSEIAAGRTTIDLYEIQSRIIERLRAILDEPQFGRPPARPESNPQVHRVFSAQLAEPSRMWATHPSNNDREENAKKIYVPSPLSKSRAWELFADPRATCEKMTALLAKSAKDLPPPATREQSIEALDAQFAHESFKRFYRGTYINRSIARQASSAAELCGPLGVMALADLTRLYPEELARQLKQLRSVSNELASLEAVRDGLLEAGGGVIRHRGRQIARRDLQAAIEEVEAERRQLREQIFAHDKLSRTAHRAAAQDRGHGWEPYLAGLLDVIHYCEHTAADLRDLYRVFNNVIAVETATRKVDKAGLTRILAAGGAVQAALEAIYGQANEVQLDARLQETLGNAQWSAYLGAFNLLAPTEANINEWVKVSGNWVQGVVGALDRLRSGALAELLVSEAEVARAYSARDTLADAHPAPRVPSSYPVLPVDGERPVQKQLGWWARFLRAEGLSAELARVAVAASIVAAVLFVSVDIGKATVYIYNGLARPVSVQIDSVGLQLAPQGRTSVELEPGRKYAVQAKTREGNLIEAFDANVESARGQIYNVASASPLLEWTAVYGNATKRPEHLLGTVRWTETSADDVLKEPPKTMSTKGGGGTRLVISVPDDQDPQELLSIDMKDADKSKLILSHARWDATSTRHALIWLHASVDLPEFPSVLQERLREAPLDAMLLRVEQDSATTDAHATICARHTALAAQNPGVADMRYIAARCAMTPQERDDAFVAGYHDAPSNAWLAMAAGFSYAENRKWPEAIEAMDRAMGSEAVRDLVLFDLARVRRFTLPFPDTAMAPLIAQSEKLKAYVDLEHGAAPNGPLVAYVALGRGEIARAIDSSSSKGRARVLRLAAASDTADPTLITRALALGPDEGVDSSTLWTSWALAQRSGKDTAHYRELATKAAGKTTAATMQHFLEVCASTHDPNAAESALQHLTPEMLGHGYAMGVVMFGPQAPKQWRDAAKRLLFTVERPYFT